MKVLILGAGPAGTSCAIELCKKGFEVTIIEIKRFPRFKPGETCHPGIEPLLHQLGVWEDVLALNPYRYNSIYVNHDGKENEVFFNEDKNWKSFQFPREFFDSVLLNKAISMGTKFIEQAKTLKIVSEKKSVFSVITDKGTFDFSFLIDATGSKSLSSIKLGLIREKYSKKIISNYSQLLTRENLESKFRAYFEINSDYWGYISLIKPNIYSITYSSGNSFSKIENSIFLNKYFKEPYSVIISKSFETSWSITKNNKFENLYLAGDALMTFDPTSSKGILKSIMSGIYVAHILDNLKSNKLTKAQGHKIYQNWANDFFQKELMGIKKILPVEMIENIF
jgi:flavin-dependent dehydrogenase